MSSPKTPPEAGRIATVVATAAVTLAVGVTVAALGGYLTPKTVSAPQEPVPVVSPTPEATSVGAPEVVLVPVAPTRQQPGVVEPPEPEARAVFAAYERTWRDDEDDDDGHERGDHRRRHEDDDDED